MQRKLIFIILCIVFHLSSHVTWADFSKLSTGNEKEQARVVLASESNEMLLSLLELRKNLEKQIEQSQTKLQNSTSESEKDALRADISQLDRQLSESKNDFERIATGVELELFSEKKAETFSWKDELSSLVEPAIKELKRFTIKARQKTELKDKISQLKVREKVANQAVKNLNLVLEETPDKQVQKEVNALLPEWINIEKRLANKLELTERELKQLADQELSLVENASKSLQTFFRNRGIYLILSVLVFFTILILCRLLYQGITVLSSRLVKHKEQRSFNNRLLYIIFQISSVIFAVIGLFFVLYLAEDWFLLSMAIIFFLGFFWTIRQVIPKLWQQGRLMLNLGAVREGERLVMYGVPWKVNSINVFCRLTNPSLNIELRLPIEEMIGRASRPYNQEEPWFPCKKGDWITVGSAPRARVVSLSHEQVETVERGGRRVNYPTELFLQACPANLSRNFRIRVPFGLSYELQKHATAAIPPILKDYIETKMAENGYSSSCLNLQVEFYQANSSSLDLMVLADFEGRVADILKRLERFIQKCCVDCCTENNWEIPYPQLTVHKYSEESALAESTTANNSCPPLDPGTSKK